MRITGVIKVCCVIALSAFLLLNGVLDFGYCANSKVSPTILLLDTHGSAHKNQLIDAFKKEMQQYLPEAEYIYYLEGSDAGGSPSKLLSSKTESPPDIVITLSSKANQIAQTTFPDVPVLGTMVVQNGTSHLKEKDTALVLQFSPEVQLQWVKNILPGTKRIGVLYDPVKSTTLIKGLEKAGRSMNMEIVQYAVKSPKQLQKGLQYINRNAEVLMAIPDPTVYSGKTAKEVLLFSYRNRIPFVGLSSTWVRAGALYAIEVDYQDVGRQAASLANNILKGEPPGNAQIFYPEKVNYSLNIRTRDHLRLDIANNIIKGTSSVFE